MPNTELRPILAIQEKEEITILNFFGPIAEKWWEDEKCFDEAEVAKAFAAVNPNKPIRQVEVLQALWQLTEFYQDTRPASQFT